MADPAVFGEENPDFPFISASDVPSEGKSRPPRTLTFDGEHNTQAQYADK